jgi:hypothetical protein
VLCLGSGEPVVARGYEQRRPLLAIAKLLAEDVRGARAAAVGEFLERMAAKYLG